ncbi:MAG: cell envelope integrity protein TolA [Deltaproteobacteria bacterium]|nr:cell envelope integrity protein TolA [Deltaproteobacteria bacterium]
MKTGPGLDLLPGGRQTLWLGKMAAISLSLHLFALAGMLLIPNLSSKRVYYSPVYSVRLIDLSQGSAPVKTAPPQAAEPPPAQPAPAKTREKPISLSPKKTDSLAKKTAPQEKISEAIERLRQEREARSVDAAIDRLRSERESRQVKTAIEGIRRRVTIGSAGAVESEAPSGGSSSGVMSIKFKMYYNLIWQRIRSVWVLPEGALGGRKDLETIVAIRIARDGQIESIQFEKKSGNPYLDESALRAIKKANPLPPLPPGFEGDKFDVGVRFSPSDL